jgi:hypothetical protein
MDLNQRVTRQKRLDYRLLNDGSDEEALFEDRIPESPVAPESLPSNESAFVSFINTPDHDILPSESVSQETTSSVIQDSHSSLISQDTSFPRSQKRPAPATEWMWAYFETTEFNCPWIMKRNKRQKFIDREIRCLYIDEETGTQCSWKTTDSARQTSTTNMGTHLRKHLIYPLDSIAEASTKKRQPSIATLFKRKNTLTSEQLLEKNLLRWIVAEKQAFMAIERPTFQQIFHDIPGISLPFSSRHTVRERLVKDFALQRSYLKEELNSTCKTIALSLDVWTSRNHLPILGIIGHWLTEDFEYREKVLEFTELRGLHSGENLAAAVKAMLMELGLESKLIAITGDNATNNEVMVSELYHSLKATNPGKEPLFQGEDSYVRCLAHILNLIVKDILQSLKSGTTEEAIAAWDSFKDGPLTTFTSQEALAKLRILALWIDRSPQRRQKWKEICNFINLPNKFIEYDVDTRWNSTFRMLSDGLCARRQIDRFLELQTDLPPFSSNDWVQLEQIHKVLSKFNEFTLLISSKKPQISLSVPIYYELHDLLHDASERKGEFSDLDDNIVSAVNEGMKKYEKYYTFMDDTDTYYIALILDPRFKKDLILKELEADENSGTLIIDAIREKLHLKYPQIPTNSPTAFNTGKRCSPESNNSDLESRVLQKVQPRNQTRPSDIQHYLDSPLLSITDTSDPNWLCNWWNTHKNEYPRMASAARDYLAIPASEVQVERLFSGGRDLLGVRRFSMKGETMRMLMLMGDAYTQ